MILVVEQEGFLWLCSNWKHKVNIVKQNEVHGSYCFRYGNCVTNSSIRKCSFSATWCRRVKNKVSQCDWYTIEMPLFILKYQPFNSYCVISGCRVTEYEKRTNKNSEFNEWNLIIDFIWDWSMSISHKYTWLAGCNKSGNKNINRSIVIEL